MSISPIHGGLTAAASIALLAGVASADILLNVDLTVVNQVTITATGGLSAVTSTGSDGIGFYLENFYGGAGGSLSATLVAGDLTSAENVPDNTPLLFRGGGGTDAGLNVWSYTDDPESTFTAGTQAFTGSGTWTLDAAMYADMLAGSSSGNIYFAADTFDDVPNADLLGTYDVRVPAPASAALLGLGGLVAIRRRR